MQKLKIALGLPAKPMWGGNIRADMCLPCCSTPFRFFQQRFSQVVGRGKSELLADVYAHRTDVVGRFVENGGNLQDGLAADNQTAHFSLRWCQRRQRCRNVGVLHPAVGHSLLHGPYQVGLSALLTSSLHTPKIFVKEFSYFLMPCHQHGLGVNLLVQR